MFLRERTEGEIISLCCPLVSWRINEVSTNELVMSTKYPIYSPIETFHGHKTENERLRLDALYSNIFSYSHLQVI